LSYGEIRDWIDRGIIPDQAVALHQATVKPTDVDWHWDDAQTNITLADRLRQGLWSADRVAIEVEGRRLRAT
jgi:hypothetical protein